MCYPWPCWVWWHHTRWANVEGFPLRVRKSACFIFYQTKFLEWILSWHCPVRNPVIHLVLLIQYLSMPWTLWSSRLTIVPLPVLVPPELSGRNHSFQFIPDDNISKAANRLCSYQGDQFLLSCKFFSFLSTPTCFSFLSTSEESRRSFSLASSATTGIPQLTWTWWQENSVLWWLFDYSVRLNLLVLLDRYNYRKGFSVMVAFKK